MHTFGHCHGLGTTAHTPRLSLGATPALHACTPSIHAASQNSTNSLAHSRLHTPSKQLPRTGRAPRTWSTASAQDPSSTPSTSNASSSHTQDTAAPQVSTPSSNGNTLSVLTGAEPIDRLRYQAMLVFEQFDTQHTGRLSGQQLEQFFVWCARKESWLPGLSEVLQQVSSSWSHLKDAGCSRDEFIRIIRQQVHAVSTSTAYQNGMMRPDVAARLQAQMSLNKQELAAAKWMFGLLDHDNDGKVALSSYKDAQGIEAYVYEDKIEDADADSDGFIVFEEFLGSYAKPKPIGKNLVIMAINSLVIFLILQAPFFDTMIKVLLVGVLFVRPQIVSRPAALLYDAIKAIIDQGKAQAELAKQNRGVWRPA